MKKRGTVGVYTFVRAAAILIVLVAFLLIVPKFSNLLFEAGAKGECQWNILVSALTRTPGLGFENIPVECKAKYMDIKKADIQTGFPAASSSIASYKQKGAAYSAIRNQFKDPGNTDQLAVWSTNKIIADEMVSCWDKVWKGELPLFDVWYRLIDYDKTVTAKLTQQEKNEANAAGIKFKREEMKLKDYLAVWNLKFNKPPVFCIVCSRIKFDKDVNYPLLQATVDMTEWMKANSVPRTKESYYQYILPDWLKGRPYKYKYNTKEPLAVVYVRINYHKIGQWTSAFGDLIGVTNKDEVHDKVDKVMLVPYKNVLSPFNTHLDFSQQGTYCDYVLD